MSETDPSVVGELLKAGATVLGALGVSGWLVRRNAEKVDLLIQDAVPRDEFNRMVQSLRDEIASAREENIRAASGTHARLDQVLLMLAKSEK